MPLLSKRARPDCGDAGRRSMAGMIDSRQAMQYLAGRLTDELVVASLG